MQESLEHKQILLIDRQHSWLQRSAHALEQAGFSVQTLNHYNYPTDQIFDDTPPDVVVLGCASIGDEERDLIARVLEHKDHLVVLSTSLPWQMMRSLFLFGAEDVGDKTYDPEHLVDVVNQVVGNLAQQKPTSR